MATSTQLTEHLNQQPDPMKAMFEMWKKTRYLVAQNPAADDYSDTKPGYYNGKVVIPGPLYNPKLSEGLEIAQGKLTLNDFQQLMHRHYIRFVNNKTTDNADDNVRQSLYTIMSKSEADSYEKALEKYYASERKAVSS